ncbi:Cytochrome P450 protein [Rutstroemia sp. NJR-2017a BVV2]|nr:Cytochrome P450 protein [Rutstroemia sp. NJR-2017a BVV2]
MDRIPALLCTGLRKSLSTWWQKGDQIDRVRTGQANYERNVLPRQPEKYVLLVSSLWLSPAHDPIDQLVHFHAPTLLVGYLEQILPHRPNPLADAYVKNACQPPESGSSELNASYSLLRHLETHEKFPPDNIPAEIMDHLAAGIDTTGDALCFIMYLLSLPHNQNVQDELRKRLKNEEDDVAYIEAVIAEGLRCFPPIPMSQPRIVPSEGIIIDGYHIPGKSIVGVQAWSLHRNPKIFEYPDEFRPERWLLSEKECQSAYLAFGAGKRRCMGVNLAMAEMRCLLKKIYSELSTSLDSQWTTHVEDMQMADQIIASRPKGQKCLLKFKLPDTVGGGVKSIREKGRSDNWRSTSSNKVQKRKTTRTD